MPIYEYFCPENNTIYSFLAKSISQRNCVPRCPHNTDFTMRKSVSVFSVTSGTNEGSDHSEDPLANMDESRMEAAMSELERDMAGMDDDNPDPRQMGHLMRRMSEITGQSLPEGMEEMVKRLEGGEDPEKLEEEYGDFLDMELGEGEGGGFFERAKSMSRNRSQPRRDPELYELDEYL